MKEQELLRAIQNADQKYYDEAEQLIHKRRVHSMKPSIIQHIVAGTAVAAALAVGSAAQLGAFELHTGDHHGDIQKDAVVVPHPGIGQGLFPVGHTVHQIIVIGEDVGHRFGQSSLILSIQQFHRASPIF